MAIQMKDLLGGSGGAIFKVVSFQRGRVAFGSAGVQLNKAIADVPGATHMRLKYLAMGGGAPESNMRLLVDGNNVFGDGSIIGGSSGTSAPASGTTFGVTETPVLGSTPAGVGISSGIMAISTIVVSKITGSMADNLDWAIEYGVIV